MKSYPAEITEYIRDLYNRRNEAAIVTRYELHGGNWMPDPKKCHENVDFYVAHVEGFKAVRGWLYFDLPGRDYVLFVQHSILESPSGELMEITPSAASKDYPFIRSYESDEEFFAIEAHTEDGHLYHYDG